MNNTPPFNFGIDISDGVDQQVFTKTLTDKIVDEVIAGAWGDGEFRKKALSEYGYDWRYIQNKVNEKLGSPIRHFSPFKGGIKNDKK